MPQIRMSMEDRKTTCVMQTGREEIWPSGRDEKIFKKSLEKFEPKTMAISTGKFGN